MRSYSSHKDYLLLGQGARFDLEPTLEEGKMRSLARSMLRFLLNKRLKELQWSRIFPVAAAATLMMHHLVATTVPLLAETAVMTSSSSSE